MLGMNKLWSPGQQPGTKSGRRPGIEPIVNRPPCSPIRLHTISLVVLPKKHCCFGNRNARSSPGQRAPRRFFPLPPRLARLSSPGHALPRSAPHKLGIWPAPPQPDSGFPDVLCMKKVRKEQTIPPSIQQLGTNSSRGPADKLVVNRPVCSPISRTSLG